MCTVDGTKDTAEEGIETGVSADFGRGVIRAREFDITAIKHWRCEHVENTVEGTVNSG